MHSKRVSSILIFLGAFAWMSIDYGIVDIFSKRPQSLHQWRQTDCLSFTENYYSFGAKFNEPQVHNMASTEGKASGEFPILYFTVAQIWKITGKSEGIYRLFSMLIALLGFYALFRISFRLTNSSIVSIIAPLLLYSSALFPFYAWNFLPNVPALSFAFLSVWLLLQWNSENKTHQLIIAILFICLAGLIKISSLIAPLAALGSIFIFSINNKRKVLLVIASMLVLSLSLYAWYSYSQAYNVAYASNAFILDFVPIWNMSSSEIDHVLEIFNAHWRTHFYSETAYFLFFILALISLLIFIVRQMWKALSFALILGIGALSYILLFFQNLRYHDYYLVELFIIPAAICIGFLYAIKEWEHPWFKTLGSALFAIFIYTEAGHARSKMAERFNDFYNEHHLKHYKVLENLDAQLTALEIGPNDLVISIPDDAPNISLYLINRRGFSNYGNKNRDRESIEASIKAGAKFLFVNEPSLLEENYLEPFTQDQVYQKDNLTIYRL